MCDGRTGPRNLTKPSSHWALQVGAETVLRLGPCCWFVCWMGRQGWTGFLTGHYFPFSTHAGSSKIKYYSSPFFTGMSHLTVLSICFSLESGLLNDHRPRGSDHHMGPELKDLFSERRFLIAVGISESDTEATIWQAAAMVCDAGNKHPTAPETRWDKCIGPSHTSSSLEQSSKSSSLRGVPSWFFMKERHFQVNKILWPITINKQKTPCD